MTTAKERYPVKSSTWKPHWDESRVMVNTSHYEQMTTELDAAIARIEMLSPLVGKLRYALGEAIDLIKALADQQAMPDDFYQKRLALITDIDNKATAKVKEWHDGR